MTKLQSHTPVKEYNQIRLEEYRTLRAELEDQVRAQRQIEIYVMGGIALVYAWLATHPNVIGLWWLAWWLPVGIATFGFLKNRAFLSAIRAIATHMLEIEDSILVDGARPLTWYHDPKRTRGRHTRLFDVYDYVMWPVLILLTIAIPVLVRYTGLGPR